MSERLAEELFDPFEDHAREVLVKLVAADDLDEAWAESRTAFVGLLPDMPYLDRRDHVMWRPTLSVFQWLAVHLATRERGVGAHALGGAILEVGFPKGSSFNSDPDGDMAARTVRDSAASQASAAPNEFVFEIVGGDEHSDYGLNMTSCAVCHVYTKHDAMEFSPYMCAMDDLLSDRDGQGLRRTGTIALGAGHCDFRYKAGGEPLRLAGQYPDRIRVLRD